MGEGKQIERHLTRSTPRWLALVAYTKWLRANRDHPSARAVLGEADRAYNRLINMGGQDDFFWGKHAATSRDVVALREVGRQIRQRFP